MPTLYPASKKAGAFHVRVRRQCRSSDGKVCGCETDLRQERRGDEGHEGALAPTDAAQGRKAAGEHAPENCFLHCRHREDDRCHSE